MNTAFYALFVKRRLGCLRILAIVNNATRDMGVKISLRLTDFNFFRYVCWNRIARSYGSSVFNFEEILTPSYSTMTLPCYIPINSA